MDLVIPVSSYSWREGVREGGAERVRGFMYIGWMDSCATCTCIPWRGRGEGQREYEGSCVGWMDWREYNKWADNWHWDKISSLIFVVLVTNSPPHYSHTCQLYDIDKVVAIEALDILDEACEEESFLKALVLQEPQLLHLGEKGAALQTRFFSVKRGFALMSRLGYLESMQEKWSKVSTVCKYIYNNLFYIYVESGIYM